MEIDNLEIDEAQEEAYHIEITCYPDAPQAKPIIVTKAQSEKVEQLKEQVEKILTEAEDKVAGAVLIKLLKKML